MNSNNKNNQSYSQIKIEVEWAKVTLDTKVKRIASPKPNLNDFISQVQSHFKQLQGLPYLHHKEESKIN